MADLLSLILFQAVLYKTNYVSDRPNLIEGIVNGNGHYIAAEWSMYWWHLSSFDLHKESRRWKSMAFQFKDYANLKLIMNERKGSNNFLHELLHK